MGTATSITSSSSIEMCEGTEGGEEGREPCHAKKDESFVTKTKKGQELPSTTVH